MRILFGALLLTACSENNLRPGTPVVEVGVPSIAVIPPLLEWGQLTSRDREVQSVTVYNVGDTVLAITDIVFEGVPSYAVDTPRGFLLATGESAVVEIGFQPTSEINDAVALILSDDPDEPATQVQLSGLGSLSELVVSPHPYDFGTQYVGCPETLTLTLTNAGEENLTVDQISHSANTNDFALVDPNSLPLTMAPAAQTTVEVIWTPSAPGPMVGQLLVDSDAPGGAAIAAQTGIAAYSEIVTDTVVVPSNPAVDILFAVDQSCSMDDHNAQLGTEFTAFINAIDALTTNWRIGVPNLSTGCFNEGILDANVPNYQGLFSQAVLEGSDPGGVTTLSERLLELSQLAITQTGPGQCNAGFLRPDAYLHVIVVSDEPDQHTNSPNYGPNYANYWGNHVNAWSNRLTGPGRLTVSGVLDLGTSCGFGPIGYVDPVNATNGVLLDICGPWANQIGDLGAASIGETNVIPLSKDPDPTTITVTVAGAPSTTGWTYDPFANALDFDTPLAEGTTVTVEYGVVGECD